MEAWIRNTRKATVVISVCQYTRQLGTHESSVLLGTFSWPLWTQASGEGHREVMNYGGTVNITSQGKPQGRRKETGGWEAKWDSKKAKPAMYLVRCKASQTESNYIYSHSRTAQSEGAVKAWCCEQHKGPHHCSGWARKHVHFCF